MCLNIVVCLKAQNPHIQKGLGQGLSDFVAGSAGVSALIASCIERISGLFSGGYSVGITVLAGIGRDFRIRSRCSCLDTDRSTVSPSEEYDSLDEETRPLILRYLDLTW